ncbi:Gfo/Idh/MocA family protein [Cohnella thailandensis]|uniref:Gfo/Idh/MocA family oxidoreductase n=1 Tax=Cohnella thailandensis TaxID=557557 RepID=A0A841SS76_9BACL|nr:Gfo/Idh/MocA family oxidoreductase [Cohnella thailandensis]MBB6632915.1 Gfo/Idh/MocA family oxidoreductase [Cohnella thailandensis]MBP1975392.1 putative dehydrogenase [Cohnella thailandensis]
MRKIKLALIGAGARGLLAYAPYVRSHPHEAEFVAVAEPDAARRAEAAAQLGLAESQLYDSWEDLLGQPKLCDAVLICTQDRMHFEPTMAALERGYHVLLEKPMSNDPLECVRMAEAADRAGLLLSICHVSRYSAFWQRLKRLLADGAIGEVVSIQHNENVGYLHYAHSFVRGNWRNDKLSSPMILAKSCHDMDLIRWLVDAECTRISSFGSLKHFHIGEAPAGSTERCTDGCAVEATCPYSAPRFYMQTLEENGFAALIATPPTEANRMDAVLHGPYGRCVYRTDNNVVDHQVVNMEFAGGATAMFSMCGFTRDINRIVQIMGTKGEIRGDLLKEEIDLFEFAGGTRSVIATPSGASGHQGGDEGIMRRFLSDLREGNHSRTLTSAQTSLESHLMAFAAEESRLNKGAVVDMGDYKAALLADSAAD